MNKYLKYFKSILIIILFILIFSVINSIINYLNISNSKIIDYLNLFSILLSFFISGYYIGNKAVKNGWLEGFKIGLIGIFLLFIISYFGFNSFNIKLLIYYSLILVSSILGSIIGINKRKKS